MMLQQPPLFYTSLFVIPHILSVLGDLCRDAAHHAHRASTTLSLSSLHSKQTQQTTSTETKPDDGRSAPAICSGVPQPVPAASLLSELRCQTV